MAITKTQMKAGCGVVAIFGAGFCGGVFCLLYAISHIIPLAEGWKSEESKAFVLKHFRGALNLTPEQTEQLRPIVDEALEKRWQLRRDYLAESRRLLEEDYLPRVEAILDESQKEKAHRLMERWKRQQGGKLNPSTGAAESNSSPQATPNEPPTPPPAEKP